MKEKENMLDENNMTLRLEKITKQSIDKHQISRDKLSKKKILQEKGITLIALVLTIIILLILAGVTLNIALSDNGLFSKTQEAAEKYKQAQRDEEDMITEIEKELIKEGPNGKPLARTVTDTNHEEEVKTEDSLGNPIIIPKGFKFAGNAYDTVQDGIIIEDIEGNQFVWIPVSNIDGDSNAENNNEEQQEDLITLKDEKKVEITLGRYTFDEKNGTHNLEQSGSKCGENGYEIESRYTENTTINGEEGYKPAKNLQEFIDSVQKNHGYYIARYEAGTGNEEKPVSKSGVEVWKELTQSEAAEASQRMYSDSGFASDLVNSYAWDTAIVYIQLMGNSNYANKTRTTSSLQNTGSTSNNDVKCNIYDMAENLGEWTTEYSSDDGPCVNRGGGYGSLNCTADRGHNEMSESNDYIGFRPLLYLK